MTESQAAIFLDRDGVIVENRANYIRTWEDVQILPQAVRALAALADSPYAIVIVTNQSAVGRGYITLETAEDINRRLVASIEAAGGRIDGVFMCPHAPDDGCDCRKPEPGLLHRAGEALDLDLNRSILIGDALTDIAAGRSAGLSRLALVLTGRGASQLGLAQASELESFEVHSDLTGALKALARENGGRASAVQ